MATSKKQPDALEQGLQALEPLRLAQRQQVARERRYRWGLWGVAGMGAVLLVLGWLEWGLGLLAIGGVGAYFLRRQIDTDHRFETAFKNEMFAALVRRCRPELRYYPKRRVEQAAFEAARLFATPTDYDGRDLLTGKAPNGCTFRLSALEARRNLVQDGAGEVLMPVFKGLFMVVQMPINAAYRIEVQPRRWRLGQVWRRRWSQQRISFGDHPPFERNFTVYSDDEALARRLLTPRVLQLLDCLGEQWKDRLYLSIVGSRVYLALPQRRRFLTPNLRYATTDPAFAKALQQQLQPVLETVDLLSAIYRP